MLEAQQISTYLSMNKLMNALIVCKHTMEWGHSDICDITVQLADIDWYQL